jgi:hypothetical protein
VSTSNPAAVMSANSRGGRELGLQHDDDQGVLGADGSRVGLLEDGADQGGHARLGRFRHRVSRLRR